MISRCDVCRGSKHVLGLGGMTKKCDACSGVGYRSFEDIVKNPNPVSNITTDKNKFKKIG